MQISDWLSSYRQVACGRTVVMAFRTMKQAIAAKKWQENPLGVHFDYLIF